jgi:hypothetical protein
MILFRHLLGAVSNAGYVKPSISYELTNGVAFSAANINSFAIRKGSTPGDDRMYGVELNAEVTYKTGGFLAAIGYGVLFPMGAMAHPADAADDPTPDFGYGTDNQGDAETAHNVQARFVLSF